MKKIILLITALFMVNSTAFAEQIDQEMNNTEQTGNKMPMLFQAVSPEKAIILQEGEAKTFCPKCGMTLQMFYKTNHAARIDGEQKQFCSMHCLAEAMADGGKVTNIKVVDNTTLEFIDVLRSWYVFGSSKPATMSTTSAYAFGKKKDAEKFAKEFGGKVMSFYSVLDAVKNTLEQESTMIKERQAMVAQKGEMMYKKLCTPFDTNFTSVAEAKTYLTTQKPCGELEEPQLQAISIYLNLRK